MSNGNAKFTLRDSQLGLEALSSAMASMQATQNAILAAIQAGQTTPATVPAAASQLTPPVISIAPINPAVVATEPEVRTFLTKPELLARSLEQTGVHDEDDDFTAEPLPQDNPNSKGPVWSSKTLRNKYGTFPAHHRRMGAQSKKLETVKYDVSPANRSNFMAVTQGQQFGIEITVGIPDGHGNEKIVRYPAVCNLSAKQFSSFDHGLYGKVESLTMVLPDGSEYVLDGQVNLQLKKRLQ